MGRTQKRKATLVADSRKARIVQETQRAAESLVALSNLAVTEAKDNYVKERAALQELTTAALFLAGAGTLDVMVRLIHIAAEGEGLPLDGTYKALCNKLHHKVQAALTLVN